MGDEEEPLAVRTPNGRFVRVAQLGRGLDKRFQHRLQIEGRAAGQRLAKHWPGALAEAKTMKL
jgi:hypothetical protein